MIKRWLTYGITLLLAFVFYGVYTGYLSLFTLAVVLLFPLFSLLVSLWPMHAARVFEPVLKSRCVAGNRPAPLLHIRSAAPFPLPRVEVEYTAVNTTFGGSAPERKLTVYGGGEEGVKCYIDKIAAELADTMQMCGAHSLAEITRDMVRI